MYDIFIRPLSLPPGVRGVTIVNENGVTTYTATTASRPIYRNRR